MSATMETLADINHLLAAHTALSSRVRGSQKAHRESLRILPSPPDEILQLPLIRSPSLSPSPPPSPPPLSSKSRTEEELWREQERDRNPKLRADLPPEKRVRLARYAHYVPEEETFRNDYSQRYVDGGEWPQNWVLGAELEKRFEEYPKQQRLLQLKKAAVDATSLPPHYLPLTRLRKMAPSKFDVILLDPPYHSPTFSWEALSGLPIIQLAGDPSFIFMWVGSGAGDGLERGREVLTRWGYRRCEDVVWVKTNKHCNKGPGTDPPTSSLFTRTKQHCLMGIRGTVRRSTDNWFVHCNIDTDVIIWEGDPEDPTRKPSEMYFLIESFCLGARRLEIFGRRRPGHQLRRGWVTVLLDDDGDMNAVDRVDEIEKDEVDSRASSVAGDDEDDLAEPKTEAEQEAIALKAAASSKEMEGLEGAVLWQRDRWERQVREAAYSPAPGRVVVPSTAEIDALRPKSPVRGPGAHNNMNHNVNHAGAVAISMASQNIPTGMGIGGMNVNMGGSPMSMPMSMGMGMPVRLVPGVSGMPSNNNNNMAGSGGPPYPMMGPPMRMGHGVMNPGSSLGLNMQNQMGGPGGMAPMGMSVQNAVMGGPMMMPQQMSMNQMNQMGMGGMGMPQMMGMGMGGMGVNMNMGMAGTGPGMGGIPGMGMNVDIGGFGDGSSAGGPAFQNGFNINNGQPFGYGGGTQMGMNMSMNGGGWEY